MTTADSMFLSGEGELLSMEYLMWRLGPGLSTKAIKFYLDRNLFGYNLILRSLARRVNALKTLTVSLKHNLVRLNKTESKYFRLNWWIRIKVRVVCTSQIKRFWHGDQYKPDIAYCCQVHVLIKVKWIWCGFPTWAEFSVSSAGEE